MENTKKNDIYEGISERTQGNIYIGVVGPVRTGKSTFIKRFMDLLVVPNVENGYVRERVRDEMPQSGAGKTIMTTEPKFVPAEAVDLTLAEDLKLSVRLIDCVGYLVDGAMGHAEDGQPRMVSTPWSEKPMPFEEAAEIGTRKVITEHSTIGLVIVTDGTISGIERENYRPAEERVIRELQEIQKPFVVILNSTQPEGERAMQCRAELEEEYNVPVIPLNCAQMRLEQIQRILEQMLYEFPVQQICLHLPGFIAGLEKNHRIRTHLAGLLQQWSEPFKTLRDVRDAVDKLIDGEVIRKAYLNEIDLGRGNVDVDMDTVPGLFYRVLGEIIDYDVKNDAGFFRIIREFAQDKKAYDKMKLAMIQAETRGYGIVQPDFEEMKLEAPELFKQGSKYGVRMKATAQSLHIIKTNITTEVAPIIGTESQSQDLIRHLTEEFEAHPDKVWDTNLFGKSLKDTVSEQMQAKITAMPEGIRGKVQKSLQKISDEGKEYFICIVL